MKNQADNAFTLIELLIVVAIIGILAAIAIPNFLNAQVKAKLARVMSDFRTFTPAYELYRLDHNTYPPNTVLTDLETARAVFRYITTPIAYANGPFVDPFQKGRDYNASLLDGSYLYSIPNVEYTHPWTVEWYTLMSFGPDGIYNPEFGKTIFEKYYDPSNGLNSAGDVVYHSYYKEFNYEF